MFYEIPKSDVEALVSDAGERVTYAELAERAGALASLGTPWVAQRVWPMPALPGMVSPPWVMLSRTLSRPTALVIRMLSPSLTAMPVESYPRYSSLERPSRIMGAACLLPANPTIPHM